MKADKALFLSICIFLLSIGICVVTIFNQDPRTASVTRIIMFYLFLFLAISSLPVNVILLMNIKRKQADTSIGKLVRRSSLISMAIVGLLLMSSLNILNLLSAITFVLAIFFGELFLEGRSTRNHV